MVPERVSGYQGTSDEGGRRRRDLGMKNLKHSGSGVTAKPRNFPSHVNSKLLQGLSRGEGISRKKEERETASRKILNQKRLGKTMTMRGPKNTYAAAFAWGTSGVRIQGSKPVGEISRSQS